MKEIGMLTVMHSEHEGLVTVGGSERGRGGCRTSQACEGAAVSVEAWRAQARKERKIMNAYVIN